MTAGNPSARPPAGSEAAMNDQAGGKPVQDGVKIGVDKRPLV
jgi:hypothetical protein